MARILVCLFFAAASLGFGQLVEPQPQSTVNLMVWYERYKSLPETLTVDVDMRPGVTPLSRATADAVKSGVRELYSRDPALRGQKWLLVMTEDGPDTVLVQGVRYLVLNFNFRLGSKEYTASPLVVLYFRDLIKRRDDMLLAINEIVRKMKPAPAPTSTSALPTSNRK